MRSARSGKSSRNRRYEDIIKTKKNGIINVAYYQEQVFKKFKTKKKFTELVTELGIHRNTIIFRINVFKLCQKYPKLLKSSIGLGFFKDYRKDIKAICKNMKRFSMLSILSFVFKLLLSYCLSYLSVKSRLFLNI